MDSVEINKIVAAVLTAGVIAMFSGFVSHMLVKAEELEKPAYLAAATVVEEPAEEEAEAPADDMSALMASAEEAAGKKLVKKCKACHTFDNGGANKIGPNLWNLVNRPIASAAGFKYSGALQGMADQTWTYAALNGFLTKPKDFAPGTKMSFGGLKKPKDRANLIAYLRSFSDSPAPLP